MKEMEFDSCPDQQIDKLYLFNPLVQNCASWYQCGLQIFPVAKNWTINSAQVVLLPA